MYGKCSSTFSFLPLTSSQSMIYLSTSHSLNNNFMTTSKVIGFNNKIGSDGIQLSEFQVFKIKKTIVIKKKFFCNVYPF